MAEDIPNPNPNQNPSISPKDILNNDDLKPINKPEEENIDKELYSKIEKALVPLINEIIDALDKSDKRNKKNREEEKKEDKSLKLTIEEGNDTIKDMCESIVKGLDEIAKKPLTSTAEKAAANNTPKEVKPSFDMTDSWKKSLQILKGMDDVVGKMQDIKYIQDGLFSEEIKYGQEMNRILFTTQGVTRENLKQQKIFRELGDLTKETGQSVTKFQSNYVRALGRGVRSQSETYKALKSGLRTSTMIGSNADETADMFADWTVSLRLSSQDMSSIAEGALRTARDTGVVGDNLQRAMSSSKSILNSLRNVGRLNAQAANSVIAAVTAAEKYGVSERMGEILSATTDTSAFLLGTSSEMQNFLTVSAGRVGKISELMDGTLLKSKQGFKDLAQGYEGIISQFTSGKFSMQDILDGNINELELGYLNTALKSAFGITAGEMAIMYETQLEISKTLVDRQNEVNKVLNASNSTAKERMELEKQLNSAIEQSGKTALNNFSKQLGKVNDIETAIQRISKDESFKEMIAVMQSEKGLKIGDQIIKLDAAALPQEQIAAVAKATALSVKEAGGKDLVRTLESAFASGDQLKIRSSLESLDEEAAKAGVKAATSANAMDAIKQTVIEINENLKIMARGVFNIFDTIFGFLPRSVLTLGSILLQLTTGLAQSVIMASYLRSLENQATHKGSLYTHDVRAERLLSSINQAVGGQAVSLADLDLAKIQSSGLASIKNAVDAVGSKIPGYDKLKALLSPISDSLGNFTNSLKAKASGIIPGMGGKKPVGQPSQPITQTATKSPTLKPPKIPVGDIARFGKDLLVASAVMGAFAVGLIAIATSVLYIGKKITSIAGFDSPEKIMEVSKTIGAILGSFAIISAAIIGGMKVTPWVKKLMASKGLMKDFVIGAAVIAGLGAVMVGLVTGLLWFSKQVLNVAGFTPEEAEKTVKAVSSIMVSSGKLMLGIVVAAGIVAALGLGVIKLSAATFGIGTGAVIAGLAVGMGVLLGLAPLMVGLAVGVVKFSQMVMDKIGITPEQAEKTTSSVSSIMISAGKILLGVVAATAAVAYMGILSLTGLALLPVTIPILALGTGSIMALTPMIATIASRIVNISEQITNRLGLDPEKAAKTAEKISSILVSSGKIMMGVAVGTAVVAQFGIMSLAGLLLLPIMIPAMALGTATIMGLTPMIVGIASGIIKISELVTNKLGLDPEKSAKIADGIGKTLSAAANIIKGVAVSAMALSTIGFFVFGALGALPLAVMAIPAMLVGAEMVKQLVKFVLPRAVDIINVAQEAIKNKVNVEQVGEAGENIGKILVGAAKIIAGVTASAMILGTIGWAGIIDKIPVVGPLLKSLRNVIINYGSDFIQSISGKVIPYAIEIIKAADNAVKSSGVNIEEAIKNAESIPRLFLAAGKIIALVSSVAMSIGPLGIIAAPMMFLGSISLRLVSSIVSSTINSMGVLFKEISKLPSSSLMKEMTQKVEAYANEIGPLKTSLIKLINEKASLDIGVTMSSFGASIISGVSQVFGFLTGGISGVISSIKETVESIQTETSQLPSIEILQKTRNVIETYANEIPLLAASMTRLIQGKSRFEEGISGTTIVSGIIGNIKGWLSSSDISGVGDLTRSLVDMVKGWPALAEVKYVKEYMSELAKALLEVSSAMLAISNVSDKLNGKITLPSIERGDFLTQNSTIVQRNTQIAPHLPISPAATAPLIDADSKINKSRAESEPAAATKATTKDLSEIAELTAKELNVQEEMLEELRKLNSSINKPRTSLIKEDERGRSKTSANIRTALTPKEYGNWPYAKTFSEPAKAVMPTYN